MLTTWRSAYRNLVASLIIIIVTVPGPFVAQSQQRTRLPLQRIGLEIKQPRPVPKEIIGYKDGQPVYYEPHPRIEPLGDGKYALRWFGVHGNALSVIYQRPD